MAEKKFRPMKHETVAWAKGVAEGWFAYLDRQRERSRRMQEAAKMARDGQQEEAQRIVRKLDSQPRVYDGANLERAVRVLIAAAESGEEG